MKGPAERPLHVASPARRRHILRSESAKYVRCGDFVDALSLEEKPQGSDFYSNVTFPLAVGIIAMYVFPTPSVTSVPSAYLNENGTVLDSRLHSIGR